MGLDLNNVKKRLENLNNKGKKKTYEKIDYTKYFFKPKAEKYQIRFVPSKFDTGTCFREIYLHYGLKTYPIVALTNFGEKDPVVDFCESLRKTSDKENWSLAKKLEPKMRIFAPVIVRGEEDKGVRLWEFGLTTYKQLLATADDEDYGDFTDITDGRDFTLEGTETETAGRPSISCQVRIKPKSTPLSTDATAVEKWLTDQPDVLSLRKHFGYDELKDILYKWMNPEETPSEETEAPESGELHVGNVAKTTTSDKFANLFDKK